MDAEQLISEAENFSPPKNYNPTGASKGEFEAKLEDLKKIPHGLSHKHQVRKSPNRRNSTSAIRSPLSTLQTAYTPSKLKNTLTCPRPTKYSSRQISELAKLKMNLDSKLKDASLRSDEILQENDDDDEHDESGKSKENSFATPSKIQAYHALHTPILTSKRRSSEASSASAKKVKIADAEVKTPARPTEPIAASPSNEQASRIIDNSHLLLDQAKSPNVSSNLTSPLANVSHNINSSHISHHNDSVDGIDAHKMLAEESLRDDNDGGDDDEQYGSFKIPMQIPPLAYDSIKDSDPFDPVLGSPMSRPTFTVRQIDELQKDHQLELGKLEELLDAKNSSIALLHSQSNEINAKLQSLTNTITTLELDRTKLTESNKVAKMRVSSLESASVRLHKQLKQRDYKISQLTEKVAHYQEQAEKASQAVDEMEHKIVSLQANFDVEKDNNDELNAKIGTLNNTISNLRVNLKEKSSEIDALVSQREVLEKQLTEQSQGWESELETIKNALETSQEQVSQLTAALEDRDAQIKDLTEFKNDLEVAIESGNTQISIAQEKEQALREDLETQSQDFKLQKLQCDEQAQEIADLHNSLESKMKELDLLFEEKEEYLQSLRATRDELDDQKHHNSQLEEARRTAEVDLEESTKYANALKDQLAKSDEELASLQAKFDKKASEISDWEQHVAELQNLLREATDSEKSDALQEQITSLQKELTGLRQDLGSRDESLSKMETENSKLVAQLESSNTSSETLHSQIKSLEHDLSEAKEDAEKRLKILAQDLYVQYAKKHEQKVAMLRQGYDAKFSNKLHQLDDENSRLGREIESLKKQLRSEREEKNHLFSLLKK